jgi:hypothetical protein
MTRIIVIALLLGYAAAAPQTEQESLISIVDLSLSGSPLLLRGDLIAYDKPTEQLRYSVKGKISVTNSSSKPIVLTVVSLKGTNVPGVNDTSSQDYYFSELFDPQSTEEREWAFGPFVSRIEVKSDEGTKWVDIEPARGAQQKVTASVLFVQFADGSTWGDRDEAKAALASRRNSVKRLTALATLYRDDGERAFIDDLLKPSDLPAILSLQYFCRNSDDKSKVVDRLFRMLASAEVHARMMKPSEQR